MAGSVTIQIADTLDDGIFKGGGPEPDTFITGGSGVQFGKFSLGSFWEFAHGTLRFPLGTTIPALSEITAASLTVQMLQTTVGIPTIKVRGHLTGASTQIPNGIPSDFSNRVQTSAGVDWDFSQTTN